jgi:hypothetical protein
MLPASFFSLLPGSYRELAHHLEAARSEQRDVLRHLALLGRHQKREASKHSIKIRAVAARS